jgi:tetratricopeptide (TPR) repeat protein
MPRLMRNLSLLAVMSVAALLYASSATAQDAAQEQAFSDQMARGVAAMEASDFATAATAFREALRAAPGHPEARTMLGTALLDGGNPAAAINQLLPVARQFPDLYAARMNLARAYLAAEREAAALPELEAAVRLQPDDHGSRARITTVLMRMGRFDDAAFHADELANRLPDNFAVQTLLGTVQIERRDYAVALTAFDAALALRPDDPAAGYGRAAALRGLGRDREAVEVLGAVVEAAPEHADAWLLFGDILAGGSDIESKIAAVDVYRAALELRPDDLRILTSLAALFADAGLDDEIVDLLSGSATADNDEVLSLARAEALFRLDRLDEARAAFEAATRFENVEAWYRLGVTEVNLAALDAAEAAYREALALAPDHAAARRELGNVLLERGDIEAARTTLQEVLVALPGDPRANYLAGLAALRGGDPAGAVAQLRRAVDLAPEDTDALYNLGLALRDSGDTEPGRNILARAQEARRAESEAVADPGAQAAAARRAGYIRYRIGSFDGAVAVLRRASELDPTDETAWFYLGLSYAELAQYGDAVTALEEAVAIRDDRAETWEILTDLYARAGRDDDAQRALDRFEALKQTTGQQFELR